MADNTQSLATGLDEEYRKPKNLTDQLIRTLDEENVTHSDRLRLIALYLLYKDGLLPADVLKLLAHAQLPPQQGEVLNNLDLLGARVAKPLKDIKPAPTPLFPRSKPNTSSTQDELVASRFTSALQSMLEEHVRGTLDQTVFPYTKPHLDGADAAAAAQESASSASLRSAKPTWAKSRLSSVEPRQRVIVFMAGGATYSESRACYEVSRATSRDVFLVTSHMLTPKFFMRQVGDLTADRRTLGIPADLPKPKAPAHLFEREPAPTPTQPSGGPKPMGLPRGPAPPTAGLANMTLSSGDGGVPRLVQNGGPGSHLAAAGAPQHAPSAFTGKLSKDQEKKEKKKHHFFSSKK